MSHPPAPTRQLIEKSLKAFRLTERYRIADQAIATLFLAFPQNKRLDDILLKVSILNDLYSTNIYSTFEMARHIRRLDIDRHLRNHSPDIVTRIADVTFSGKPRPLYSFATKYCSWHDPQNYPIFDGFVERMLLAYRDRDDFADFSKADLREYSLYKEVLERFRSHYGLRSFSFREIDKTLWLLGRKYFPRFSKRRPDPKGESSSN